jgi:hypothetical protein
MLSSFLAEDRSTWTWRTNAFKILLLGMSTVISWAAPQTVTPTR